MKHWWNNFKHTSEMPKYLEISFFVQQPCKYSTVTSLPLLSTIHKKLSNVLSDSSTFTQWGTALTIIVSLPRVTSDFVCTPASFLSDLILGAYGSGLGCVQSCGVSSPIPTQWEPRTNLASRVYCTLLSDGTNSPHP